MSRFSTKKNYKKLKSSKEPSSKKVEDLLKSSFVPCCLIGNIDSKAGADGEGVDRRSSIPKKNNSHKEIESNSQISSSGCFSPNLQDQHSEPAESDNNTSPELNMDMNSSNDSGIDSPKQFTRNGKTSASAKRRNALILTSY